MTKIKNIGNKIVSVVLAFSVMALCPSYAFSIDRNNIGQEASGVIQVYIKPDVTILVNGEEQLYKNELGNIVYPVIYKGSTYLPIRAISKLMGEEIEWNEYTKTIFIGKTLHNPNKIKRNNNINEDTDFDVNSIVKPKPIMASAYLRPTFLIMYDFNIQTFFDENGNTVFPIVIDGSTYLPIRAAAQMMNQKIEWNGITKTIKIQIDEEEETVIEKSEESKKLISQFEKQLILYDNATVKIQNIQAAKSEEELLIIANEVSSDYALAVEYIQYLGTINFSNFDEKESIAFKSLAEFSIMSEQYILILENIAYLAAMDQDYSMLIETFVDLVIKSQKLLDETRLNIESL